MKPKTRTRFAPALSAMAFLLTVLTPALHAQINYQGHLTDVNNVAENGTRSLTFKIYTTASGGVPVWGPRVVNAEVVNGFFNVVIPSADIGGKLLKDHLDGVRYLGITVGLEATASEISPRQQILAAPKALHAESATQADTATNFASDVLFTREANGTPENGTPNGTERVGIGTATPSKKLDVNGDVRGSFIVRPNGSYENGSIFSDSGWGMLFRSAQPNPSVAAFSFADTNDVKLMTITPNGNVGIGTTAPGAKLDIHAPTGTTAIRMTGTGTNAQIWSFFPTTSKSLVLLRPGLRLAAFADNGDAFFGGINSDLGGGAKLTVKSSGNVGIGTTNPQVKLDVTGSSLVTMVDNGYNSSSFTQSGTTWTASGIFGGPAAGIELYGMASGRGLPAGHGAIAPVGIRAEGWIASARGFMTYSDCRIKRDIQASAPVKDLATIQQLQVTDYRMVDPADGGMAWRKGFIAQEVEKVIPLAVTRSTEFVPDIFSVATTVAYDLTVKTLTLTLSKDHGLKRGGRVRLHMDGERVDLEVSAVPSNREFVVKECDKNPKKVLVYGRQVEDFRTVDYDRIFTTTVGAVQELASKVETHELEIAALKQQLAAQTVKDAAQDEQLAALIHLIKSRPVAVTANTVSAAQ